MVSDYFFCREDSRVKLQKQDQQQMRYRIQMSSTKQGQRKTDTIVLLQFMMDTTGENTSQLQPKTHPSKKKKKKIMIQHYTFSLSTTVHGHTS